MSDLLTRLIYLSEKQIPQNAGLLTGFSVGVLYNNHVPDGRSHLGPTIFHHIKPLMCITLRIEGGKHLNSWYQTCFLDRFPNFGGLLSSVG